MKTYDVIVIGAGGGAKIITPASRLGLKVAAIEKDALGGTCLNRGCIPSKMLIHPADVATEIKHAHRYDINVDTEFTVDFKNLIERISGTVDTDSKKIEAGYAKNPNIDFYHAPARFVDNRTVAVDGQKLTAEKIFIATGARPDIPDIPGLAGTPFMTSTEALRNTRLPRRMIVIGGGYIGCELGHAYGALGSDVHFLVRSVMLRREDPDVVDEFGREFSKLYTVHLGCVPSRVEHKGSVFTVTFKDAEGREQQLTADALLVATGVVPNTDQLGLENTDIQTDANGFIRVDNRLRTGVKGVYALGDCVGNYMFRHSVNWEGEYLFRTVFTDPSDEPIVYGPMPHAVFTCPQIAGAGLTEPQAKEQGLDYVVGLNPYKSSAMGMAFRSESGFVKLIIERSSRKILGVHIIGPEASDMVHMVIALMYKNGTLDDLLNMVYIHPALPEIVRNAARKAQAELSKSG